MHGPEHREETAFTRRFPEDREHFEKRRLKAGPRVKVVARDEKRNAFRVLHRGVCDVFRGVEEQRFAWRKPHGRTPFTVIVKVPDIGIMSLMKLW